VAADFLYHVRLRCLQDARIPFDGCTIVPPVIVVEWVDRWQAQQIWYVVLQFLLLQGRFDNIDFTNRRFLIWLLRFDFRALPRHYSLLW
jgi:hypothetical protein